MLTALVFVGAYLLGSIPFSYLVARWWGVADVRTVGSGNVGATNVLRAAGKAAGATAFFLDFVKGVAASLLGQALAPGTTVPPAAAMMAVIGHMYPVWLGFRGGKGVATGAGAFLPLVPLPTAASLVAFLVVVAATRYASLGSVAGCLTLGIAAFASGAPVTVSRAAAGVALLVVWKHRSNLERIARGTERRLGGRTTPGPLE